jgi:hypothetical protein
MRRLLPALAILILPAISFAQSKITLPPAPDVPYNNLAKTPPMGWNSWNKFANRVSDEIVRQIADAIARNGMQDAGYVYVNIDDTWDAGRDAQGNIQTNSKFPDMKALADYVHSKGLKIGIYTAVACVLRLWPSVHARVTCCAVLGVKCNLRGVRVVSGLRGRRRKDLCRVGSV